MLSTFFGNGPNSRKPVVKYLPGWSRVNYLKKSFLVETFAILKIFWTFAKVYTRKIVLLRSLKKYWLKNTEKWSIFARKSENLTKTSLVCESLSPRYLILTESRILAKVYPEFTCSYLRKSILAKPCTNKEYFRDIIRPPYTSPLFGKEFYSENTFFEKKVCPLPIFNF